MSSFTLTPTTIHTSPIRGFSPKRVGYVVRVVQNGYRIRLILRQYNLHFSYKRPVAWTKGKIVVVGEEFMPTDDGGKFQPTY